jgi:hypothetical protein
LPFFFRLFITKQIIRVKAFLYTYQRQERAHGRILPANSSDLAMRSLEKFVDDQIDAGRLDDETIHYDEFLLFLKSYQLNVPQTQMIRWRINIKFRKYNLRQIFIHAKFA